MPTQCVAVGCSNTHSVPGISLHRFPKCDKLRKLWVLALKRDRWEPSKASVLCSAHFKPEDFVRDIDVAASLPCRQLKRLLKPEAIPSVFAHCKPSIQNLRPAFEKRRRIEMNMSRWSPTGATATDVLSEPKYIVFESCLVELLGPCRTCLAQCSTEVKRSGSLVQVTAICPFGHVWSWQSQPSLHRKAAGNILLANIIVTDRHSAIRALLRKEYPEILHLFDCWHMAKGKKKKLLAASKRRGVEVLEKWARAAVNHLYWSAASSDGHPEQIVPKWSSLTRHVINVHQHDSSIFPRCVHGDLSEDKRLWLDEGK
ncbi:uncharacterized protein LOC144124592 [Amblyomma americanum]